MGGSATHYEVFKCVAEPSIPKRYTDPYASCGMVSFATCIRIRIDVAEWVVLQQKQLENTLQNLPKYTTNLTINDAYLKWL